MTPLIVGGYVALAAAPFVYAATHTWFWVHLRAPGAAMLVGLVLVALLRRQRWAWVVLIVLTGFAVVSYAWGSTGTLVFIGDLVSFALLVSPPMREYVRDRI
jgi:hypothetical protein